MSAHTFRLGLLFISIAVVCWGILPIALKLSGAFIDPVTLTWFRYAVAFVTSFVFQLFNGRLVEFKSLKRFDWLRLSFAALFSIGNYVSFVYCLDYLTPDQAQLNFQTAPFFLAFGGVLFFKEKLKPVQMMCFATLALGMMLFFHPFIDFTQRLDPSKLLDQSKQENTSVWLGLLIVQFSAMSWTCYSLIQKSMVARVSPANFLLFIYGFATVVMLPASDLTHFAQMQSDQWWVALFCAFNTLVAYGCFAQSMKYWSTSKIGPMVALTPVCSLATTWAVNTLGWWPEVISYNPLDTLSTLGIVLVVLSVCGIQLLPVLLAKFVTKPKVCPKKCRQTV
ncbi:MAG: DMT family transporter [Algicola sp.]|nr:DMT family transporter [Algicola sp.]